MKPNWINEDEAARLLGIKKRTLKAYVSRRTLTQDLYKRAVTGALIFDQNKLFPNHKKKPTATKRQLHKNL